MQVLGLITARGGSKGVPRKNVRPLAGRPLIAWTIEAARVAKSVNRVVVSTDDAEIAAVSREAGAEVPFMRPVELARDDSPHVDCVLHAVETLRASENLVPDLLVLLQPTSPLRDGRDIDAAVDIAKRTGADAVVSVVETHDHPFLVRRVNADGLLEPFVPCDLDYPRRQDLPPAYAINGAIYVFSVPALLSRRTLEFEKALPYVMPPERSLQIDTPWDMELCELVLEHRRDAHEEPRPSGRAAVPQPTGDEMETRARTKPKRA